MFHLLVSEFCYNKLMLFIAFLANVFIFLTFSILDQRDNVDLFFNPSYWNFSTEDVIMFNPIFIITLTILIIIPVRFLAQIPSRKTDRFYSLLPLSRIKLSVARYIFPILFWLTLTFFLILTQIILYPISTISNTIVIILSLNGVFFILCSFFLMTRDISYCLIQKTKILGIPYNLFPSIFLVLIYSVIVLSLFITDTIYGTEHFTQQRSEWLLFFFSFNGAIVLNILGFIALGLSIFIFKKRLTFLE